MNIYQKIFKKKYNSLSFRKYHKFIFAQLIITCIIIKENFYKKNFMHDSSF